MLYNDRREGFAVTEFYIYLQFQPIPSLLIASSINWLYYLCFNEFIISRFVDIQQLAFVLMCCIRVGVDHSVGTP